MITRLKIEGLFGRFNYDLVFKDPVTILTGPNGFGKSTVLRMIEALRAGEFGLLFQLDFEKIDIGFSDWDWEKNQKLPIRKEGENIKIFNVLLSPDDAERISVERMIDFLYENAIPFDEFFELAADEKENIFSNVYGENDRKLMSVLHRIGKNFGNVKLISEQRLLDLDGDEDAEIEIVLQIPQRLKDEIDKADNEFAKKSSGLDSVILKRINESEETTEEHYTDCERQLNDRLDKLRNYNLKDEQTQSEPYQKKNSAALIAVLNINLERYSAYDDLLAKLDLFVGIVNNRLMFKKLDISRSDGFKIVDTEKKAENDESIVIPLEQLSSGEKQVIVMYYNLIFNDNENLLLLIDEPEISMHIVWQRQFMDDLIKIAKHGNFRAIVATHSPQLIGKHRDIQIDLGELYGS